MRSSGAASAPTRRGKATEPRPLAAPASTFAPVAGRGQRLKVDSLSSLMVLVTNVAVVERKMIDFVNPLASAATAIGSLVVATIGWMGLNFFGKPIVTLRETRRKALEVAERYAYVGLYGLPSEEYQTRALAALHDAGNSLRAYVRENALATRIYCWGLHYDLDFAARAALGLGEAARGEYKVDEMARRLTLHALFVALGSARHLSAGEIAAARAEMKKWHYGNRDMTTFSSAADNA
jgi:hypothetical protein